MGPDVLGNLNETFSIHGEFWKVTSTESTRRGYTDNTITYFGKFFWKTMLNFGERFVELREAANEYHFISSSVASWSSELEWDSGFFRNEVDTPFHSQLAGGLQKNEIHLLIGRVTCTLVSASNSLRTWYRKGPAHRTEHRLPVKLVSLTMPQKSLEV